MAKKVIFPIVLTALFIFSGCCSLCTEDTCPVSGDDVKAAPTIKATKAQTPVKIDGILDDAVWQKAKTYQMHLPADRAIDGRKLEEPGAVKLAWDEKYLYLGIEFTDSEIKATGTTNNQPHYKLGDLCEFFIKPVDTTNYWELYVTPANYTTKYFFGKKGDKPLVKETIKIKAAASNTGTFNDPSDKDKTFSAEMAVKLDTIKGEKFTKNQKLKILVARYNYSKYLKVESLEYSSTPALSATNYHLLDEYAELIFEE